MEFLPPIAIEIKKRKKEREEKGKGKDSWVRVKTGPPLIKSLLMSSIIDINKRSSLTSVMMSIKL